MPRVSRSTGTPAWEARYSSSMTASSTIALALKRIRAGAPSWCRATSSRIRLISPARTESGATSSSR